ncbi:MAG: TauD/TfdA family dioxygenase, partial [Blastocatellia bacterium]
MSNERGERSQQPEPVQAQAAAGKVDESLVRTSPLEAGRSLPLLVTPRYGQLNAAEWALCSRDFIEEKLLNHGAVLLRGFNLSTAADFESFARAAFGELLEYRERSSPRSRVQGNVYTSTDYPADQEIFLHNENSYQQSWPMRVLFFCVTAPPEGGQTPIADCRRVYDRIPEAIRDQFRSRRWMYVRNFHPGFGLNWQTVFQTTDRGAVDDQCRKTGVAVEWVDENRLRIRASRDAIAKHPQTGELTWFNHATFFHIMTLDTELQESLRAEFDEADLPSNTYFGDGLPISLEVLE